MSGFIKNFVGATFMPVLVFLSLTGMSAFSVFSTSKIDVNLELRADGSGSIRIIWLIPFEETDRRKFREDPEAFKKEIAEGKQGLTEGRPVLFAMLDREKVSFVIEGYGLYDDGMSYIERVDFRSLSDIVASEYEVRLEQTGATWFGFGMPKFSLTYEADIFVSTGKKGGKERSPRKEPFSATITVPGDIDNAYSIEFDKISVNPKIDGRSARWSIPAGTENPFGDTVKMVVEFIGDLSVTDAATRKPAKAVDSKSEDGGSESAGGGKAKPTNRGAASVSPKIKKDDYTRALEEKNRRLQQQLDERRQAELKRRQAVEHRRLCGAWTCVTLKDGTVLFQTEDGSAWIYRKGELAPENIWPKR